MDSLTKLAEENNLTIVYESRMPKGESGLIYNDKIFLKSTLTDYEKREVLAEEIGHYKTTVGNIIDQSDPRNRKQELQARDYGCKLLINLDGLIACYKSGIDTPYEVADFFEVTEPYLWRAIDMYRRKLGINFIYNGYEFDLSHGLNIRDKSKC